VNIAFVSRERVFCWITATPFNSVDGYRNLFAMNSPVMNNERESLEDGPETIISRIALSGCTALSPDQTGGRDIRKIVRQSGFSLTLRSQLRGVCGPRPDFDYFRKESRHLNQQGLALKMLGGSATEI
jgi:hypothetical protein